MADTVYTHVIFNGSRRYIAKFTNISDGTGENDVKKVDRSTLIGPQGVEPSKLAIEWVEYNIRLFDHVELSFDATSDDEVLTLSGNGYKNFGGSPLVDPVSAGNVGDLLFTTSGAVAGAVYDITVGLKLK